MRRALLLAFLALTASCGGAPMAPSTNAPQASSSLASGAYLLTVSMSTSGSGVSSCVSLTAGAPPAFAAVFVPTSVHVNQSGPTITVTPDDPAATFRMQLQLTGSTLSGAASGQYQSGGSTIAVSGASSGGAAIATGVVGSFGPYVVSGMLTGTVSVQDMSCTNNGHTWTLMPRS